jgi:hypothetical protein
MTGRLSQRAPPISAFATRAGYEVVGTFKETASGVRLDRAERKHVLALVQRREMRRRRFSGQWDKLRADRSKEA